MTNCLITGGAGFIGCAVASLLADRVQRLVIVDCLHPQIHATRERPLGLHGSAELIISDITDRSTWDSLLRGFSPELVIHLAAETGTGQSLKEATRHASVNVVGTTQMLDAFVRHSTMPGRIVLASSRAVYGEGAWQDISGQIVYPGQRSRAQLEAGVWDFPELTCLPFEATRTTPNPTSIYGATKLAQEMIISTWARSFGVGFGILRLQNVYGPGQSLGNPYTGIVPLFAQCARSGNAIPLYEDGEIIRDFVFIDDVASAIVSMAFKSDLPEATYDIGSGEPSTIRQLALLIADIYRAPPPVVIGKYRHGDVRSASCDVTRACNGLNWRPRFSLETGMKLLCAWIDAQIV